MSDVPSRDVHFEVDYTYFAEVNGLNPDSIRWFEACERLNLSSAERIFFALCRSMELDSHVFKPGDVIVREGSEVHVSHIMMNGYVNVSQKNGKNFRVGIGGVFGLAEGVMNLPHTHTVIAECMVTTSFIPLSKVQRELPRIHKGLQGIERCTMLRILNGAGVSVGEKS